MTAWLFIKRPSSSKPKHKQKQNLCVDKAYHSKEIEQEIVKRGYIPHIRHRREERIFHRKHPARRWWVVERTNSWHNRFRKLFTRYEKKEENSDSCKISQQYYYLQEDNFGIGSKSFSQQEQQQKQVQNNQQQQYYDHHSLQSTITTAADHQQHQAPNTSL